MLCNVFISGPILTKNAHDHFHPLVGVSDTTHTLSANEDIVVLGEDDDIGSGDGCAVLDFKEDVVDTAHVEGRGWLPDASLCGEGEDVHESGRGVGPLHDRLYFTEEKTRGVVQKAAVAVK